MDQTTHNRIVGFIWGTWVRNARLADVALQLRERLGEGVCEDHNRFRERVDAAMPQLSLRVPAAELKLMRDTEQVPLLEEGGIEAFIRRELLPYTPDAWVKADATKVGCEISFTRHFCKPKPLRTLAEISADILAIEREAEGLLDGLLVAESRT